MATPQTIPSDALEAVRREGRQLTGAREDYDALLEGIGSARLVLLGEASHGTHEFYSERARITRRLIEERGFDAVAIEGDWPDAYRVNRFVQGASEDADAEEALRGFKRFPTWMWRNADVLDFVGWLREHNDALPAGAPKVGFYGLDVYSLAASMQAVVAFLEDVDPRAAERARRRYACLEPFRTEGAEYGQAVLLGISDSCRRGVLEQLVELRRSAGEYPQRDGLVEEDEVFVAEQNARVVADAEEYYRTVFGGQAASWNLRDRHMADTLDELVVHLDRRRHSSRVVVWAHNSHVGDARQTAMAQRGELNIGQLARERHPSETMLVGFSTYTGTVTAARDWGAPAERRHVRPALPDSHEALFHATGRDAFLLAALDTGPAGQALRQPRLQRAIGVIYHPESERQSHYFAARAALQFDALIHLDRTRAVEPLERNAQWQAGEPPETYPSAL